jgi:hypothetical protein
MTVRRYITENIDESRAKVVGGTGYYQDINQRPEDVDLLAIGSTNYNTFINEASGFNASFLNGSVDDFYDPYRNKILSEQEAKDSGHICLPFLFTQSGIKPMTSVSMSRRYVELFDNFSKCDVIGVVGFGFNSDDGHINGLFRELIEDKQKKVVLFHYSGGAEVDYETQLRIPPNSTLVVEKVDSARQAYDKLWIEKLLEYI